MKRPILLATFVFVILLSSASAQTVTFQNSFKKFSGIVPGVDFFLAKRNDVALLEKPLSQARQRLAKFLGEELANGAIVICSSAAQKDTVTEDRLIRMGYKWALIQMTPEAAVQQQLAQIKAQLGEIPPQLKERLENPEMKANQLNRMVSQTVQRMCFSILTTTLAPEKKFRVSRYDDVGRTPAADWVDIGLVQYAVGEMANLRYLQDRTEEAFPLEDVVSMSRPFLAPESNGGSGGGPPMGRMMGENRGGGQPGGSAGGPPMMQGGSMSGPPGGGMGGPPSSQRSGAPGGRTISKEQQDRMFFDAQASSFFVYLIEKAGIEKVKNFIVKNKEGMSSVDLLLDKDMLGGNFDSVEASWLAWLKAQQAPGPARGQDGRTAPPR